jgi:hypothetical protein
MPRWEQSIDIAATLLKPILGRGIRRNLRLEAEGLKRQSETAD